MKTRIHILAAGIFLGAIIHGFGQPRESNREESRTSVPGTPAVVITKVTGAVTSAVATLTVIVPPTVAKQPTNQSVSLGADVTFTALAAGTAPRYFQWRFNETNLPGKTSTSLLVTNVQLINAGDYTVVVTNVGGSATSHVAHLDVDPTFTKITTGRIVNDGGFSISCAWGDYDDDGFIDLFVANWGGGGIIGGGFLYHNNTNGTFTRILAGPPVNNTAWLTSATWGDYDNDGFIDLYVTTHDEVNDAPNFLYHNNGNETFTLVTKTTLAQQVQHSSAGVWGDYDNDGWLDLFVANYSPGTGVQSRDNILYHNDHQGDFIPISFGKNTGGAFSAAWGDFDNDGFLDLAVPQGGYASAQHSLLYQNNRNGALTLLTNSIISADVLNGEGCAWGDFDNDGWPDLCIGNFYGENNSLFHNNRDGTFTKITNSIVALDGGTTKGVAWGDYDNDGWLDLFVSNLGPWNQNGWLGGKATNFLYHNNGDGTFTRITSGSLVHDLGNCAGAAWGDYDNDGFLDLFAASGFAHESENNLLYRNNGNSNSWLNLRLTGTASNRSAIGAKVRVQATIGGKTFWQLREISGGSGFGSQNDLRANFGLGDATNAEIVRIEWPSGIVQTMTNVAAKQFLTVVEHQDSIPVPPRFTSASRSVSGAADLAVSGNAGFLYVFEGSTNLLNWTKLAVRTNLTGDIQFTDTRATNYPQRFYRVSAP